MCAPRQALLALALSLFLATTARAEQRLVIVVTDGWSATRGELRRFTRADAGGAWQPAGDPVPVVVGRTGLAWGRGLRPRPAGDEGPDKREGDGRAPAGRFALGDVTGYDPAAPAGTTLPYRQADAALRCVDDPAAPAAYNRLVEAPAAGPAPWASAERMRRDDELYRLTVFVRHNDEHAPGAGSCVFLHVWRSPTSPTVGCTAMTLPALRALVAWIDARTELVQLPRPVYLRLVRAWDLPPLAPLTPLPLQRK
jgi:L,D-peptidoglycan transpeptidase YkuD (ErfK/YbiS/YcfS/YnhG family)